MFSPAPFVFFAPYENWFRNLLPLWTCKPSGKMFSPVLFVASAHMKMGSRTCCRFGRASHRAKYFHWWCWMIRCLTKNEFRE